MAGQEWLVVVVRLADYQCLEDDRMLSTQCTDIRPKLFTFLFGDVGNEESKKECEQSNCVIIDIG